MKGRRYGRWGGFPRGHAEDVTKCALEVCSQERGVLPHQCNRKRGHGPSGMYCKQHSTYTEAQLKFWTPEEKP